MKDDIKVPFRGFRGQFLETICVRDGIPIHLEWHQLRIDATMQYFFPSIRHEWFLEKLIEVPRGFRSGLTRCRVIYDDREISFQFYEYIPREVHSLKIIELPDGFDYRYKYAERTVLDGLFGKRKKADDVLLIRDGWITDTSIANIAFLKNDRWYTPSMPLLAGTTWKRLVKRGTIITRPIHVTYLSGYDKFKIFNAMRAWEESEEILINNILK